MSEYITQGAPYIVSPANSADRAEAEVAAVQSDLAQQKQFAASSKLFGARSVSPPRPPVVLGVPGRSALKAHPYRKKPYRSEFFYQDDGLESLKAAMRCDSSPNYAGNIPFTMYTNGPSKSCSNNGVNKYLSWDPVKGKYCCHSNPDTSEMIMDKSLQTIASMISRVAINRKSNQFLDHAIKKYLRHFSLLNNDKPELVLAEKTKMDNLMQTYQTGLTDEEEPKSERWERSKPLFQVEANAFPEWNTTYARLPLSSAAEPSAADILRIGGGRTRVKRNRSKRNRSKRNLTKNKNSVVKN